MKLNRTPVSVQVKEKLDEEIRAERIRLETEETLRNELAMQEFFSGFQPSSVESFIRQYARRKAVYLTQGPQFADSRQQQELRYKTLAEKALWEIQQKKLFNLQCQWRAEQIRLKGIEHSAQFQLLSVNIAHCPFISPVSRAEVDLYAQYLLSDLPIHFMGSDHWQDYESFRAEYENPGESRNTASVQPVWYRFYDEQMGTYRFYELPDIRGEKECRYRSAARRRQLKEIKSGLYPVNRDKRPFLSILDMDLLRSFVEKFEDRKTMEYCLAVENFQRQLDDDLELEEALETLRQAEVAVSIRAGSNWKEKIIEAAFAFERRKVVEILPLVHQEYLFRVENGIIFRQSMIDKKKEEYAFQLCETVRKQILEGRRILGEPENFSF